MTRTASLDTGLAYRRVGSGPPILLLHGLPGSGASWLQVAELLSDRHELVVPDLLGFGASAKPATLPELHASAQADALAGLLEELAIERVAVVGHDFGGPVAVELAGRHPARVSQLGVLATNLFPDTPIPFPLSTATWPLLGRAARRLLFSRPSLRAMLRTGTGRPPVALDPSTYLGDASQLSAIRTIFAGSLTSLPELYTPVERHTRALDVPTLAGWGTRDPFFSVKHGERTAVALSTTLRLYTDAGHFLPEERPHEVAEDIATLASTKASRRVPPTEPSTSHHPARSSATTNATRQRHDSRASTPLAPG